MTYYKLKNQLNENFFSMTLIGQDFLWSTTAPICISAFKASGETEEILFLLHFIRSVPYLLPVLRQSLKELFGTVRSLGNALTAGVKSKTQSLKELSLMT